MWSCNHSDPSHCFSKQRRQRRPHHELFARMHTVIRGSRCPASKATAPGAQERRVSRGAKDTRQSHLNTIILPNLPRAGGWVKNFNTGWGPKLQIPWHADNLMWHEKSHEKEWGKILSMWSNKCKVYIKITRAARWDILYRFWFRSVPTPHPTDRSTRTQTLNVCRVVPKLDMEMSEDITI